MQLAYLSGGPQRVADVVALGFMAAKAPAGGVGGPVSFGTPIERFPMLSPFRDCLTAEPISTSFRRLAIAQAQGIRDRLEGSALRLQLPK